MVAYQALVGAGVTTRTAAGLTGVSRSTAARHATAPPTADPPADAIVAGAVVTDAVSADAQRPVVAADMATAAAGPDTPSPNAASPDAPASLVVGSRGGCVAPGQGARPVPVNRLSPAERARVQQILTSEEFIDSAPLQVYAALLARGEYVCSVSTMYRILAADAQVRDRRRQARHPARVCPELLATGPGQVYTWDITKLPAAVKGQYYDAYVMIDIYSRYIVGAYVHNRESADLAEEMMREVFDLHGTPTVLHADRGTSMTSKTVAVLLADLGVTRSHSRPRVSNDNPYSEAWFKTMKYAPVFPERFGSLTDARIFLAEFVEFYNHNHHHIGIGMHTPADVHYGLSAGIQQRREQALHQARQDHPERFRSNTATPKILTLPDQAWINQPAAEPPTQETAAA